MDNLELGATVNSERMNTTLLRLPKGLACPSIEAMLYYRLESMDMELVSDFMRTWCRSIEVNRFFFSKACYAIKEQLELFNPTAFFKIHICRMWLDTQCSPQQRRHELAVSIFHEMIHIFLEVIGYPDHDENRIEQTARLLAKQHPEILDIMESLYPGFSAETYACGKYYQCLLETR
jgi:hypothetical protein